MNDDRQHHEPNHESDHDHDRGHDGHDRHERGHGGRHHGRHDGAGPRGQQGGQQGGRQGGGWDQGWGDWGRMWPQGGPGDWGGGPGFRGSRGSRGSGGQGGPGFGPGGRGRPGPPPWVQELVRQFGGPGFGPEFGGRRGPRARRGDVRAAILDVLAGDEMNGYQIIQEIAERSGGAWKPSPGSVYPTVQQLEDEGLVEGRDAEGKRLLRLTDEGRSYVEEHGDEMAATWRPFESAPQEQPTGGGSGDLMPIVGQVMGGMWQIVTTGTAQQKAEAAEILTETRRKLYRLLADGDPE